MKFGLVAALAVLAAAAAPAADAATSVHIDVALPGAVQPYRAPVQVVQPVRQVVPVQPVYGHPGYTQAQYGGYQRAVPVQQACGAPRWDPRVRYMPGQVVWRQGSLWMAKGVSARVWNENSPPEWTPQYWTQAACR
jgi:hypothetical protein